MENIESYSNEESKTSSSIVYYYLSSYFSFSLFHILLFLNQFNIMYGVFDSEDVSSPLGKDWFVCQTVSLLVMPFLKRNNPVLNSSNNFLKDKALFFQKKISDNGFQASKFYQNLRFSKLPFWKPFGFW